MVTGDNLISTEAQCVQCLANRHVLMSLGNLVLMSYVALIITSLYLVLSVSKRSFHYTTSFEVHKGQILSNMFWDTCGPNSAT